MPCTFLDKPLACYVQLLCLAIGSQQHHRLSSAMVLYADSHPVFSCNSAQGCSRSSASCAPLHSRMPLRMRLAQVEKLNDESVKLKTLQTALTLMQSPVLAQSEVGRACLSDRLCFALAAHPRCHTISHIISYNTS